MNKMLFYFTELVHQGDVLARYIGKVEPTCVLFYFMGYNFSIVKYDR